MHFFGHLPPFSEEKTHVHLKIRCIPVGASFGEGNEGEGEREAIATLVDCWPGTTAIGKLLNGPAVEGLHPILLFIEQTKFSRAHSFTHYNSS